MGRDRVNKMVVDGELWSNNSLVIGSDGVLREGEPIDHNELGYSIIQGEEWIGDVEFLNDTPHREVVADLLAEAVYIIKEETGRNVVIHVYVSPEEAAE